MVVTVGPGRHAVQVEFKDSLTRMAGKIISLFVIGFMGIWFWIAFVTREEYEA